jgi:acyl-CoA dehydrogenase
MPSYKAPVDDVMFLLDGVLEIERYNNLPGFEEATLPTVRAILEEAGKVCEEVLQPLNASGDREGCHRAEDGTVTTPRASGKPTPPMSKAAGSAFPRPSSSAAWACRRP